MTDVRVKTDNQKFCMECGATILAKAEICPKCGVRQAGAGSANGKNKITAGVLALFLGGIGVHKFYLGSTGWGIAYLLFCWTFIPAIVALIEGVILLVMSDDAFNRKYGG